MDGMKKQKKSKMTLIGKSEEVHVNDVGNPYLHSRHQVGISKFDKGKSGRAIVYDQHIIDTLFKNNLLTPKQHQVCDKYLSVIVQSIHMSNPQMAERISTGKYYISATPRSGLLIKVQRHLKKAVGQKNESRFWVLMCDSPKSISEKDVTIIQVCADALRNFYYVSDDHPVSSFQQALQVQT